MKSAVALECSDADAAGKEAGAATADGAVAARPAALELKSSRHTLVSVSIRSTEKHLVHRDLLQQLRQAPGFLANSPVIVDFSNVKVSPDYDFKGLFRVVRLTGLLPVAVSGLPAATASRLQAAGVPVVDSASSRKALKPPRQAAKRIDQPVVAGSPVIAGQGDLIICSSMEPGSEIAARGNIYVYGTLRGHAQCGTGGDQTARIFCTALDADLVSVAGCKKVTRTLSDDFRQKPLQIHLVNGEVSIELI